VQGAESYIEHFLFTSAVECIVQSQCMQSQTDNIMMPIANSRSYVCIEYDRLMLKTAQTEWVQKSKPPAELCRIRIILRAEM